MFVTVELLYRELGETGKGKENHRVSVISHTVRWEGRGYKDVF
jgi:hypothetical protein